MKILGSTTLKTADQAFAVLEGNHEVKRFFGIKFRPSFRMNQDVLEQTFNKHYFFDDKIRIPRNIKLVLKGKGIERVDLAVHQNAKFIARQATFNNVESGGATTVLKRAKGYSAVSRGSLYIDEVCKDNHVESTAAYSKIGIVKGNNFNKSGGCAWIGKILGHDFTDSKNGSKTHIGTADGNEFCWKA